MANKKIVFGGGCFWCTEAVFDMIPGVVNTEPGYAGGDAKDPDYWKVAGGGTGHAEVLLIEYNPERVRLERLLEVFFTMHDPTALNYQGADAGTEYRSIILYNTEEERATIEKFIATQQKNYKKPIVTEVKKLTEFYKAESEHRKFYERDPDSPYCTFVIKPKLDKVRKKFGL